MRIAQPSPFAGPGGTPPPPPQPPPRCKHTGGHPRAGPETTKAVLAAFDAGKSIRAAGRAGGVDPRTAKAIWLRERGTWPPPGAGSGSGGPHGGGRPATVTPQQAREAIKLRGNRKPGGGWERSIPSIAAEMQVSVKALRWAIAKEEKRSEEKE